LLKLSVIAADKAVKLKPRWAEGHRQLGAALAAAGERVKVCLFSVLAWPGIPVHCWLAVLGVPLPPTCPRLEKHTTIPQPPIHPTNHQAIAAYQRALDLLPNDQDTITRIREVEAAARCARQLPPLPDEMGFDGEWPNRNQCHSLMFECMTDPTGDDSDCDEMGIPLSTDGSHLRGLDGERNLLPGRSSIWIGVPSGKIFQVRSEASEGKGFTERSLAAQIVNIYQQEAKMNPDGGDDDCRNLDNLYLRELKYCPDDDVFFGCTEALTSGLAALMFD